MLRRVLSLILIGWVLGFAWFAAVLPQPAGTQRADAVVNRLAELGVDRAMLSAKGYGQDKPKAGNDSEEGRAQNRRIEFNVNR